MGPNTNILTKRDRALILTLFDLSLKKAIKKKEIQNRMKNDRVNPVNVLAQKW